MFTIIFMTAALFLMLAGVLIWVIETKKEQEIMRSVESGELRKYFDDYFEKYLASEEFKARSNRIIHEFMTKEEQKG